MKRLIFMTLALTFSKIAISHALEINCPTEIKTKQQLVRKDDGWEPYVDKVNERYVVRGIGVYEGHPKGLADLIGENGDTNEPGYWKFEEIRKGRSFWLVCRYQDTSFTLTKKIPDSAKSCHERPMSNTNPTISLICE